MNKIMNGFAFLGGEQGVTALKVFLLVSPLLALWLLVAGWMLQRTGRPRYTTYLWLSLMLNLAFCGVLLSCLSTYYFDGPPRPDWMPVLFVIPSLVFGVINVFLLRRPKKP